MESKISIDVDYEMNPAITIKFKSTEDVRDRLVGLFLQKAIPKDVTFDGFARISRLNSLDDGTLLAEIIPIHPMDAPKHIDRIRENAGKFGIKSESVTPNDMKRADDWLRDNLPHPLYKRWVDEVLYDATNIPASQGVKEG
jgi:hypothetical protein